MSSKADISKAQTELKEHKESNEDNTEMMDKLEEQIDVIRKKHQAEMTAMQKENEAKVKNVVLIKILSVYTQYFLEVFDRF